jgi:hypothetical protein
MRSLSGEVDPEGKLTAQERAKRVEWAMKAHMQRMALKSAKARRRKHPDTPVTGMETRLTPAAP